MGHNIVYLKVPEKCFRDEVQDRCNRRAAAEDWQEGCSGVSPIRWLDSVEPLDSEDAAYEYIKTHDRGDYYCFAVRFKQADQMPAEYVKLCAHRSTVQSRYDALNAVIHYKEGKSQYVSCKQCGSKLATAYMRSNYCPLCNTDLRPPTVINKLSEYKRQLNELTQKILDVKNTADSKGKNIFWLVKYEYHT